MYVPYVDPSPAGGPGGRPESATVPPLDEPLPPLLPELLPDDEPLPPLEELPPEEPPVGALPVGLAVLPPHPTKRNARRSGVVRMAMP
jgi:hypothetical protein